MLSIFHTAFTDPAMAVVKIDELQVASTYDQSKGWNYVPSRDSLD